MPIYPFANKMKKYYTTGEVAKMIGISERTAKNYCTSGKILSDKTPLTNYHRISYESLVNFLNDNGLSLDLLLKRKKPLKVLIVDDEEQIVYVLAEALKELSESIIIETAFDGYEACIKAGVLIPDLILLDLNMPKADGFEVCRSIRNHEDTKNAKIIIISGYVSQENLDQLQEFRPIGVFMKPFSLEEIMGKIKHLIMGREKH